MTDSTGTAILLHYITILYIGWNLVFLSRVYLLTNLLYSWDEDGIEHEITIKQSHTPLEILTPYIKSMNLPGHMGDTWVCIKNKEMQERVDPISRLFLTVFINTVLEDWGRCMHWLSGEAGVGRGLSAFLKDEMRYTNWAKEYSLLFSFL